MILSHSHRFVFVHIHKTAGEAISRTLGPFLPRSDICFGSTASREFRNAYYRRRYKLQKHTPAREIREFLPAKQWEEYFKFCVVRHPIDRARSLYHYFEKMDANIKSKKLSARKAIWQVPGLGKSDPRGWPGMHAYLASSSFDEFVRHPNFGVKERGTRPQIEMVGDEEGRILVDFVAKFEDLDADFRTIAERIGLPTVALPMVNASRNRTSPTPISEDTRAYLAKLYAKDFEAFGYEP